MKNIANADRPKSAGAMLPPRPLRRSGKVAQTACNSDRREGKSCIPTLNQTFADSRILKISKFRTFRIAAGHSVARELLTVYSCGRDSAVSAESYRGRRMKNLRPAMVAILLATSSLVAPRNSAFAQTCACGGGGGGGYAIQAEEPPPPMPVYDQPPIPEPGYLWTPGYWSYNGVDYYWAPGTWIEPPQPGVLWTPGYWASWAAPTFSTEAIGDRTWAFTAGFLMASAIPVPAIRAGVGTTGSSSIT